MSRLIKIALSLLILVSPLSQATILKCTGMYSNGDTMHVIFDDGSYTLNVDGDVHKIQAATEGQNGLATENFQNENGKSVYISIVNDNGDINLKIFEPIKDGNDKLIDTIHLACTKE